MSQAQEVTDLEQLLEQIRQSATGKERVSLGDIVEALGPRSFGPVLLLAGVVTLAPLIGDIPGVPTLMGLLVFLTAAELLLRRKRLWLPRWLLRRSVARDKVCKGLHWMQPAARWLDRLSRPRLTVFSQGAGAYAIAIVCLLIAAAMPPMELVPFTANGAGLALTVLGLALITRDGLLALLAYLVTAAAFFLVAYSLL